MPLPVKLHDLVDALQLTSDSITYFLDRRTGEIEMVTEEDWSAAGDEAPNRRVRFDGRAVHSRIAQLDFVEEERG